MSELRWVRWTQWDAGGMVGAGQMPLRRVQEHLRQFEAKAKKMLDETGADHVVYGVKHYKTDDGVLEDELEEVRFYLQPMDDERFERDVASMKNVIVYAVHKMK